MSMVVKLECNEINLNLQKVVIEVLSCFLFNIVLRLRVLVDTHH